MKTETLAMLEEADCAHTAERPLDFDRRDAIARAESILQPLRTATGLSLELEPASERSSYLADVAAFEHGDAGRVRSGHICVRLSSYGRLATIILWHAQRAVAEPMRVAVVRVLESAGYDVVDPDELEELYLGKNEQLRGHVSWWTRFFDQY
jgi:hypothetical protein